MGKRRLSYDYNQPEIWQMNCNSEVIQDKQIVKPKKSEPTISIVPETIIISKTTIFDIFLYTIAGISAVISGYNSFLWFVTINQFIIAIGLALMLVSCSIIFPVIYKTTKKSFYLILAYIAIFLSVFTTIAGQYNNYSLRQEQLNNNKVTANIAKSNTTQLILDESRLNTTKTDLIQSKNLVENIISVYVAKEWGIKNQQIELNKIQEDIKNIDTQLNDISAKKQFAISQEQQSTITRKEFHGFIAGIFNVNANIIELLIYCIFAIFIDIVCPLVAYNIKRKG